MKVSEEDIRANLTGALVWKLLDDLTVERSNNKSFLHGVAQSYFKDSPLEVDFAEKNGREIYELLINDSITYVKVMNKHRGNTGMMMTALYVTLHIIFILQSTEVEQDALIKVHKATGDDLKKLKGVLNEARGLIDGTLDGMHPEVLSTLLHSISRDRAKP